MYMHLLLVLGDKVDSRLLLCKGIQLGSCKTEATGTALVCQKGKKLSFVWKKFYANTTE